MDRTLYVVSGFMRTGTSMMMKALEAGGMTACHDEEKDKRLLSTFKDGGYHPNVGGLYELEQAELDVWGFPVGYEGKLIKALNNSVPGFAVMPDGIRVIFMMRNPEEIKASFIKFFGKELIGMEDYKRNMADIIKRIRNRKDVKSVTVLDYEYIVNSPRLHFGLLSAEGWPIDADKASAVVDSKLRHCYADEPKTISRIPNLSFPTVAMGSA